MSALPRKSPKVTPNWQREDIKSAIDILEDLPRLPEKTPASSSADGYEGEVCADGSYLYIYRNGSWKRTALSTF